MPGQRFFLGRVNPVSFLSCLPEIFSLTVQIEKVETLRLALWEAAAKEDQMEPDGLSYDISEGAASHLWSAFFLNLIVKDFLLTVHHSILKRRTSNSIANSRGFVNRFHCLSTDSLFQEFSSSHEVASSLSPYVLFLSLVGFSFFNSILDVKKPSHRLGRLIRVLQDSHQASHLFPVSLFLLSNHHIKAQGSHVGSPQNFPFG